MCAQFFVVMRFFLYGFLLFAGLFLEMEMPFFIEGEVSAGSFMLYMGWGVVGGVSLLVAYLSARLLGVILFEGHTGNDD